MSVSTRLRWLSLAVGCGAMAGATVHRAEHAEGVVNGIVYWLLVLLFICGATEFAYRFSGHPGIESFFARRKS